jgi:acetolactate synthase-1/2/3 large subunit
MTAAQLLVKCLENEGVEYIFGIPGEENIDIMDALLDSPIRFITTRHEQGAAFMADVYGRLTGRAGVCMATLGPGATNLITGFADANMDRAPIVAIAGQGATTRLHKESHQILNLVNLFQPIAKYATQILEPEIVPEVVRKAFKVAQTEKPGGAFIEFPENIAEAKVEGVPIEVQTAYSSAAPDFKIDQAAKIISEAKFPVILAGNGVIRQGAAEELVRFAEMLKIPVANSFMAKGVVPFSSDFSLGTIGLKARDLPWYAFERADVVICIGYDMVEYHPDMWNPNNDKKVVHIDALPAEVDGHYIVSVGVLGDISSSLRALALKSRPQKTVPFKAVRNTDHRGPCRVRQRHRLPDQAPKNCLGFREVLAPDALRSRTWARTRCGWRECIAPNARTPASFRMALRPWESRCRGQSRRNSPIPSGR